LIKQMVVSQKIHLLHLALWLWMN